MKAFLEPGRIGFLLDGPPIHITINVASERASEKDQILLEKCLMASSFFMDQFSFALLFVSMLRVLFCTLHINSYGEFC